jgi:hypothetical protein
VGVILGVGVDKEPVADGYLRGQVWNRPHKSSFEWLIFETIMDYQYADRWGFPLSAIYLFDNPITVFQNTDEDGEAIDGADAEAGLSVYFSGVDGALSGGSMIFASTSSNPAKVPALYKASATQISDLSRPGGAVLFRVGVRLADITSEDSIIRFNLLGSWVGSDSLAPGGNTSTAYLSPDFDDPINVFDFGGSRIEQYPLLQRIYPPSATIASVVQDVAYFDFDTERPTESGGFASAAFDLESFAQSGNPLVQYQLYPGIVYSSLEALN